MLAFAALVAPLLATSVHALTLQPRGAPTEAPGAVGFQFPPLRGWAQGAASESPCGGFVRQGTTDYPMSASRARTSSSSLLPFFANSSPLWSFLTVCSHRLQAAATFSSSSCATRTTSRVRAQPFSLSSSAPLTEFERSPSTVSYGIGNPTSNDAFQPLVPMVDYAYSGSQCFRAPDFGAPSLALPTHPPLRLTFIALSRSRSRRQRRRHRHAAGHGRDGP